MPLGGWEAVCEEEAGPLGCEEMVRRREGGAMPRARVTTQPAHVPTHALPTPHRFVLSVTCRPSRELDTANLTVLSKLCTAIPRPPSRGRSPASLPNKVLELR